MQSSIVSSTSRDGCAGDYYGQMFTFRVTSGIMFEPLFNYFKKYTSVPFTQEEEALIKEHFVLKKFRKRQFFLQEGEMPKLVAFILKGSMRKYSVDEKGEEHIHELFLENWWVSDRESVLSKTASAYFIDAWEPTEALVTNKDFEALIDKIPALKEWEKKLSQNHTMAMLKRLNAAIKLTAEQRYARLVETNPEFLQRFPQHIIASYLGINKVTLSRIKSGGKRK